MCAVFRCFETYYIMANIIIGSIAVNVLWINSTSGENTAIAYVLGSFNTFATICFFVFADAQLACPLSRNTRILTYIAVFLDFIACLFSLDFAKNGFYGEDIMMKIPFYDKYEMSAKSLVRSTFITCCCFLLRFIYNWIFYPNCFAILNTKIRFEAKNVEFGENSSEMYFSSSRKKIQKKESLSYDSQSFDL